MMARKGPRAAPRATSRAPRPRQTLVHGSLPRSYVSRNRRWIGEPERQGATAIRATDLLSNEAHSGRHQRLPKTMMDRLASFLITSADGPTFGRYRAEQSTVWCWNAKW
jgi:hypothetical protein